MGETPCVRVAQTACGHGHRAEDTINTTTDTEERVS